MNAPILPIASDRTLEPETTKDWQHAHERIVALGRERAGHERLVCRWLVCAERLAVHARCGYASLREYAERMLGISGRQTEERLRVGRALMGLPELDDALASGRLTWSAVRELTRIANADTEREWVDWADGRRVHEVEHAVSEHAVGDGPDSPSDATRVKHRLSFEVRAETMALFRDLQAKVRADLGHDTDDDTLLFEIARRALGGPEDVGLASYQVAVVRRPAPGKRRWPSRGGAARDADGPACGSAAGHAARSQTVPS